MKPRDGQQCEFCRVEASEPGECDELAVLVSRLFDVQQPDVKGSRIETPDGKSFIDIPIYDYALGTTRSRSATETPSVKYVKALVALFRERFQRTFGEAPTGRRFWWRERPNAVSQYAPDIRGTYYQLWFRCAIENLTDEERAGLSYIPEFESVRYERLQEPL